MYILGLNHGEINSSAALYHNGKIIAAAPEERFNRIKRSKSFPKQSVQFCLDFAGIKLKDVDYIVQAWYPGAGWIHSVSIVSQALTVGLQPTELPYTSHRLRLV